MAVVFSKILLRTKVSGNVQPQDLIKREIIFGNIEKSIYVKDYNGNMISYHNTDDMVTTNINTWSATKIEDRIQYFMQTGGLENLVIGEEPQGIMNGVNTDFILAHNYEPDRIAIFLNGLRIGDGDIVTPPSSTNIITLAEAPLSDWTISADYIKE